jgi:ribonuclease P protein component, eubacterial
VKFSESLKKNYEFRRLYSRGKSAALPVLVIYCRKTGSPTNRLGITVTTKLGKAVQRNRVRRRLKEIYRTNEHRLKRGFDVVLVARVKSRYSSYFELEKAFLEICGKLGILKSDGEMK